MATIDVKVTSEVFESYLRRFEQQEQGPRWLVQARRSAFDHFAELGFPSHRHEDWRHTNVSPIAKTVFQAGPRSVDGIRDKLQPLILPGVDWSAAAARLVFINGHYAAGASSQGNLPEGVRLGSLAELVAAGDSTVEKHLGKYATGRDQAFVALNTAFLADGALIEVPGDAVVQGSIEVLFVSTSAPGTPTANFPRVLVVAGRGSKFSIVENYISLDDNASFTNAVTEIFVDEDASVEHTRIGQENRSAWHVGKIHSQQQRGSRFTSHVIALGGALVRHNLNAILGGEGAETLLTGLSAIDGKQHVDNFTILDHAKPLGTSREYYKGVLDGQAEGVFSGRIIVREDAQHTDAIQSNKNLLLSDSGKVESKPQLEIYADDVRCTHGATVGQLDEQALFYLQSRGIGRDQARSLLTYAFAADVLGRISDENVRKKLEAVLFERWNAKG